MTDELLGELAARMKLIADALPQHKLSALQALGLARECVRQMAWARKQTFNDWTNTADFSRYLKTFPTTVAPEDYQP